ncbi:acetoin utilization protein AcuC [soil metagenome]
MRTAFVWDRDATHYRFGPDHPFNPKRLELTVSLIEAMGLLDADRHPLAAPRLATEEELLRVHSPEYVAAVRRLSARPDAREAVRWGLGPGDTPAFAGMHEATSRVVGGSLRAAELVMSGKVTRAFNISGGLHHARRDRASGFCIYNDLAAAIAWIREAHDARVLYIDYDAHHGDGVQGIFYSDPDVLTLSVHQSGRSLFPGTGFVHELGEGAGRGFSWNLPLEPLTDDAGWIPLLAELLPRVAEAFRPDVIVLQNGCDGHALDPLTHLRATTRLYEETTRIVGEIAGAFCGGRIVAAGGGGYAIWQAVPRAWTLVWAGLSGQTTPERIPAAWLERWEAESPVQLPHDLRDLVGDFPPVQGIERIRAVNRSVLAVLLRDALPLLSGAAARTP